jgi:Holliday junction resolvasome RuvABC endonuclease subunit
MGFSVCSGADLRDWGVKNIQGRKLKDKLGKIKQIMASLINQYQPGALAIKNLNPARSSENLDKITAEIITLAERQGLKIYQYRGKDLKQFFSPEKKINKKELAERVAREHPVLFRELEEEKKHRNPYRIRMFEAVGIASACLNELDN